MLTEDGVGGVQGGLIHGCLTDQHPCGSHEGHAGQREVFALVIGDDLGVVAPIHGSTRVCRAQVTADRRFIIMRGCHRTSPSTSSL
jgi:hypothetical protein